MAKEIKYNIKIGVNGKEELVSLATPLKELHKNIDLSKTKADKLTQSLADFANVTVGIKNVAEGFAKLRDAIKEVQTANANDAILTGLDGKELVQLQSKAKALSNTFGAEYNEVMLAALISRIQGLNLYNYE